MTTNKLIKQRRKQLKLSQLDVAKAVGVSEATVSRWESGNIANMGRDKVMLLSQVLDIDVYSICSFDQASQLLSDNFNLKSPSTTEDIVTFPVVGEIAAGYDEIALEDWSGETIEVPTSFLKGRKKEEYFALSVHGSSMYPLYMNGDKVLILKQNTLDNSGDIGAILYDDCATLKKVEYISGEDWLRLIPINPEYQPKCIEGADLERCRVIGIPKLLIREI